VFPSPSCCSLYLAKFLIRKSGSGVPVSLHPGLYSTPSPPSRRDAIFSLASCLFKIFFALDTHKLCSQIMQIVRPHLPRLDATYTLDGSLSQADPDGGERRYYVAAEEVEFRWLVGKWLLGQRRLVEVHLGSVYEVKREAPEEEEER
jgi:hypothetical protein